ncbi:protein of unknown function [Sterolibacterium denitrificans]|uniref:Uncharacterized protein n=2 Tax=Sterolibacterium denitrificans TaxID=157592 RepID=A0A656Z7L9_9PROT|nr:TlpA disulfide reductase family protein [Sterolibacterium denitrificans]KYC29050.1 hypothetical protein ACY05_00175 [Sterolibacterium denitrificans]SMB21308.1 protein of unknown function [Sterolibacterium denitrificans]
MLLLAAVAVWLLKEPLERRLAGQDARVADAAQAAERLFAEKIHDLAGIEQPFSQWKGKLLVVNLWATWCPPCRTEMPGFSRLQAKYAAKNVQFVGIALDTPERVRAFAAQTPVDYPLLIGSQALTPIFAVFGNTTGGLPFTVILDRDGQMVRARLGLWREAALDAALAELI